MNKIFLTACTTLLIASIPTTATASDLNEGKEHYQTLCISCHGKLGHGDGLAAQALSEKPSNIHEGLTSWFESESELIDTVLNGNEGMPAWSNVLDEQDVKNIFSYIESINQ